MLLRDASQLLTYEALETIQRHQTPMKAAIGHVLNETSKTLWGKDGHKKPFTAPNFNHSSEAKKFNDMIFHDAPLTEKAMGHIMRSEKTLLDDYNGLDEFVRVYRGLYPYLVSPLYAPYEFVHMIRELIKDFTQDEPKFIEDVHIHRILDYLILIVAMEYGYSKDFEVLKNNGLIFDMGLAHREYWLYEFTERFYPMIKDKITLTPNLQYVFEFDRYAEHVQELADHFDSIGFNERKAEVELPSGVRLRPMDYMLRKTSKTADPNSFMLNVMTRFAYINHHTIEKGDYYLMAPPLVEYLKFERSSNHWQAAHDHLFVDPEDEAIRFKVVHIHSRYYAQRLIGTPICDYCSRIYPLTPKHILHIKNLEYPTFEDLKTIHENNLAFDMYRGL